MYKCVFLCCLNKIILLSVGEPSRRRPLSLQSRRHLREHQRSHQLWPRGQSLLRILTGWVELIYKISHPTTWFIEDLRFYSRMPLVHLPNANRSFRGLFEYVMINIFIPWKRVFRKRKIAINKEKRSGIKGPEKARRQWWWNDATISSFLNSL